MMAWMMVGIMAWTTVALVLAGTTVAPALDGATVALVLAGTTVVPALDGVTVALALAGTTVVLAGITVALAVDLAITMTTYNTDDNTGYGSYSFYRGGYGYFSRYNGFLCSFHCMLSNKPAGIEK